jgi:hypothetical protein
MRGKSSLTFHSSTRGTRKERVQGKSGEGSVVEDREFGDKRKLEGILTSGSVSYVTKNVGTYTEAWKNVYTRGNVIFDKMFRSVDEEISIKRTVGRIREEQRERMYIACPETKGLNLRP